MEPAARPRLQSTSGGSSETELNELAVSPASSPDAVRAVTMVTPVANMPSAERKSRGEKSGGRAWWPAERAGDIRGIYMKIHE
ncbi:hypothetical protein D9M69_667420 [compost metagenome]